MEFSEGFEKRRSRGRVSRTLYIGLAAFPLLFSCLLLLALHVPAFQDRLIQTYLQQVEKSCGLQVHLQGHDWNIVSGLRLTGIQAYAAGREFLICEEARASGGFSLQWPFFHLQEIHLIKPVLHLEKGQNRQWRLPSSVPVEYEAKETSSSGEEDFPWELLPRIRIESGQIIAEQAGQAILSVRDVTGVVVLRLVPGSKGPKLMMDFESGGQLPDGFSGWLQRTR